MPRACYKKTVKVAHVTTIDVSLRYLLLNQLCSIRDEGYDVYGISRPGPDIAALEAKNIKHIPVPMVRASQLTPLADMRAFWHLYKVFRREQFTIVHTHTAKADLYGQIAARLAGVPIVLSTQHGFYFHENMSPPWRRFYVTLSKIGARCSDVILSQNPEDIHTAIEEKICKPEDIKYLGNGIDVEWLDPDRFTDYDAVRKRQELGLPVEGPVVGFVGRLVEDKGILELLQAARMLREHRPDVRFLIVGPVDRMKQDYLTPEVAAEYGVADLCIFTGKRYDMPELYHAMDIFVLPSHREAFPRSVMEAAAMALPCVVTDVRGCRTTVEQGRNGVRVPLGDVQALAQAILDMMENPGKAQRMGRAGRQMALQQFDERRVFDIVKTEYARLLKEKGILGVSERQPKQPVDNQTLSE